MIYNFGKGIDGCEDCWDGQCTMNCSGRLPSPLALLLEAEGPPKPPIPAVIIKATKPARKKKWESKIKPTLTPKEESMTDRIKGLVVTFDKDYRDDDIEPLVSAIRMLRGVVDVSLSVADVDDHINRMRITTELRGKLFDALSEEKVKR